MAKISAMKQAVQAGRTQGRTTTKEKVRRKRGVGITQERRGKHLKRAKEARRVRKNEAEQMLSGLPPIRIHIAYTSYDITYDHINTHRFASEGS